MTTIERTGTTTRTATPRGPDDPEPDLCDYRVVHRAMTRDLARLATVADDLAGSRTRGACACCSGICAGYPRRSSTTTGWRTMTCGPCSKRSPRTARRWWH